MQNYRITHFRKVKLRKIRPDFFGPSESILSMTNATLNHDFLLSANCMVPFQQQLVKCVLNINASMMPRIFAIFPVILSLKLCCWMVCLFYLGCQMFLHWRAKNMVVLFIRLPMNVLVLGLSHLETKRKKRRQGELIYVSKISPLHSCQLQFY